LGSGVFCCKIDTMEIQIAVAKTNKYASIESGDTLEVVERPNGGLSVVLSDGQTSGKGAKIVSSMVVRKTIALLAEGVRDGAAARAASDYLYTEKNGKVSATLNIFSIDFMTKTLVITRNNSVPVYIYANDKITTLSSPSGALGTNRNIRPSISEIPITTGLVAVMFTDGLNTAGERTSRQMDFPAVLDNLLEEEAPSAQHIADTLLNQALWLDEGRPGDDMSVVVLRVSDKNHDEIRRMLVSLPVPDIYQ
jgi:serine phosphatase RsbU (regulator of sigma subunit)